MWAKLTPCLQADGQWIVIHQIFSPQTSDNHLKGFLPFCKQAGKLSSPANLLLSWSQHEVTPVSDSVLGHWACSALCWHIRATKTSWCSKQSPGRTHFLGKRCLLVKEFTFEMPHVQLSRNKNSCLHKHPEPGGVLLKTYIPLIINLLISQPAASSNLLTW